MNSDKRLFPFVTPFNIKQDHEDSELSTNSASLFTLILLQKGPRTKLSNFLPSSLPVTPFEKLKNKKAYELSSDFSEIQTKTTRLHFQRIQKSDCFPLSLLLTSNKIMKIQNYRLIQLAWLLLFYFKKDQEQSYQTFCLHHFL